jgi:hypothetical protein
MSHRHLLRLTTGRLRLGGLFLMALEALGLMARYCRLRVVGLAGLTTSGSATFYDITKHGFNIAAIGEHYINLDSTATTSPQPSSYIVAPYNGTLQSITLLPSATTIGNRLFLYNGATLIGTVATFNFTANTPVVKTFTTNSFSQNSKMNVRLYTDSATSNDIQVSMSWNYSTPI